MTPFLSGPGDKTINGWVGLQFPDKSYITFFMYRRSQCRCSTVESHDSHRLGSHFLSLLTNRKFGGGLGLRCNRKVLWVMQYFKINSSVLKLKHTRWHCEGLVHLQQQSHQLGGNNIPKLVCLKSHDGSLASNSGCGNVCQASNRLNRSKKQNSFSEFDLTWFETKTGGWDVFPPEESCVLTKLFYFFFIQGGKTEFNVPSNRHRFLLWPSQTVTLQF